MLAPAPAAVGIWWDPLVTRSMRRSPHLMVDIDSLIIKTLEHSPRVAAVRQLSRIAATSVVERSADFDPLLFSESKLIKASDPVGNELETQDS